MIYSKKADHANRVPYGVLTSYKQAGKNGPTTALFGKKPPIICDSKSFQKSCLSQTMSPLTLHNHAKIRKILSPL